MEQLAVRRRPRFLLKIRLALAGLTVLACALFLWARQTTDALLRVSSYVGAVGQVLVFFAPTGVAYILLARRPASATAWGVLIAGSNAAIWWSVARDSHSTASLGPALLDWALLPITIGLVSAIARLWRTRDTTFGVSRPR